MQTDPNDTVFPSRKTLPHGVPAFAREGSLFFITVCGEPRGLDQFANNAAWHAISDSVQFYNNHERWYCRLLLAMPDHVHAIASFPEHENMKRVVADWKRFLAGKARLTWQRDFFDHRLRSHESLDEKAHYIRANPVRAGLVTKPKEWPFVWSPPEMVATPAD